MSLPGSISLLARLPNPSSSIFGNVDGPSSSTANALVRFNGTTGKIIQNGVVTEDDYTGTLNGPLSNATVTAVGSAFTNQPTNDGVEVLSANAGDTTQTVTIIGTTFGGNTVVVETVNLNGTTVVSTVKTDWGVILAVKKSAVTLGTVTVRKATGDGTITAGLTAAVLSVGVNTVSLTAAYNRTVSVVSDGATTKQIGWQGTNSSGTVIYDSKPLNGTTAVVSSSSFLTLTEIYTGDVEVARTETVTTNGTFTITGGSPSIVASGTNQDITLTPSDSGAQGAVSSKTFGSSTSILGFTGGFQISKQAVSGAIFPAYEIVSYANGQTAQAFLAIGGAGGTQASPTTLATSTTIGGVNWYGLANSLWKTSGSIGIDTSSTFGNSNFSTNMFLGPSSSTGQVSMMRMAGGTAATALGKTMAFGGANLGTSQFLFDIGGNASFGSAWGITGAFFALAGRTATDTVSSGTVTSAMANSFGQPTFAASSATTWTDGATLYIAGGPVNGTNGTVTRPHSLSIVDATSAASSITGGLVVSTTLGTAATSVGIGGGNVNMGGTATVGKLLITTPSALTYASPTSVDVTLNSCFTVTTVNATGSVTFNATAGGTTGQQLEILITNDATSAKTITFGSNFKSTGTLTASAASRQTTITFRSDGTNFLETGRAVLTT